MKLSPKAMKTGTLTLGIFTAFLIWLLASSLAALHQPTPALTPPNPAYRVFKSYSEADSDKLRKLRSRPASSGKAVKLYVSGLTELASGNTARAEGLFKQAAALDPKNQNILAALSRTQASN